MSYIFYNPNPLGKLTSGDCTVRAISKAMGWSWDKTYAALAVYGMKLCEMPSANQVWGAFLSENGFQEYLLTRSCKKCYSVYDFCRDFPKGIYILGTDNHAVAVINGNHYDSFDSGDMNPTYYFKKIEKEEGDSNA